MAASDMAARPDFSWGYRHEPPVYAQGGVPGEQQVGDLVRRAGIHQSGVSRHLRILSESSFVSMRQDGQRHLYSLKPEPFYEINQWLSQYRELWEKRLDRFDVALKKKQKLG